MAIKLKGLGPLSLQTLGTINISLQMQGEEFYTSGENGCFILPVGNYSPSTYKLNDFAEVVSFSLVSEKKKFFFVCIW